MLSLVAVLVPAFFLVIPGDRQCEWGKYGEHCNVTCPKKCATVPPSNLQHCDRNTGNCSAGCQRGWHGDLCDQSCSATCLNKTCNLQTGYCTLGCNGSSSGDFCNSTRVSIMKEEADNLSTILTPVFLVVAVTVAAVVTVVVAVLRRYRRNTRAQKRGSSYKSKHLLSPGHEDEEGAEAEVMTPLQTGIMSEDLLQEEMEHAETVFKKTAIYYRVKKELEKHRHVTMSGSAGAGKTAIALKLGKQYQDKGFTVFFVTDVCKINLSECLAGEGKVCFIFNDIFKTVEFPRDKACVDRILRELEQELNKCKTSTIDKRVVYAIFTANTSKGKGDMSELGEPFFSGSSFINFTLKSCQYSRSERKKIFNNHCKSGDLPDLDVDRLCNFEQSVFGFPQTCKLFSAFPNHQKYREDFFREPFRYLRVELEEILRQMNNKSGALVLMFLCKDTLNLREVEIQSDNQDLENMLRLIEDVVHISSRTKLAESIRHFSGTFFTKGDTTGFAHPSIYDACACALFSFNPSFVLEHCHMKFLRDHVRPDQHLETSTVDQNQPTIHVSDVYTGIVNRRRALDGHSEKLPTKEDCNAGVMSKDWLDKQLMKTEEVFVETSIYHRVKKTLETHGHVTMSGVAGGGKTAIALMLGKHYEEEQGFLQVHIAGVSQFKLDVYLRELSHRSVCFIFHDIFRITERSRDKAVIQSVLGQLIDWKNRTQEHKLYTIFTANTYNNRGQISQLGDEGSYFFSGPSFLDFNEMSCLYKSEEKSHIFDELCKGVDTTVNVEKICRFKQSILGFPQICQLFVMFESFQNHAEDFFQRPFYYLKERMNSILEREDEQSAALILMFLCDGPLNLHQVELPSDNKDLEDMFTTLNAVVGFTTRTAVAIAVRQFRGSFFSKGDITSFAHPTIYVACAIALYKDHQALVLRYASIRFLCEHVYTEVTEDTLPGTMISVPKGYIHVLTIRLSTLDTGNPNYTELNALIGKLSANISGPRND